MPTRARVSYMENKDALLKNPTRFKNILGIIIGVLLLFIESVIFAQFLGLENKPAVWKIFSLAGCVLVLDVLCFVELYFVKTLKARIVIYCFDFVLLLFICALTGSTYFAGLYCVILSQLYLSVENFRTKTVTFVASCVAFAATCVAGWFIIYKRITDYGSFFNMITATIVGVIVIAIHFVVFNFLFAFYCNNVKLAKALKEADESKKELEEAYNQLSETAVFKERNRIARDIHDNAGHSMTAVIMQTEAAKLIIDSDPEEAKAKIISANIQAKNALEQMRESVHLLAGRSEAVSLKEEIGEIIAQTMDGTDVKIRFDIAELNLSGEKRRFVCNSLKECFSNGMRHGGASAFYVELAESDGRVTLTVSDNGEGLPEDFKEGYGLRGIREKAAAFGGGIVYESERGDGCEIKITIEEGEQP